MPFGNFEDSTSILYLAIVVNDEYLSTCKQATYTSWEKLK